MILRARRRIITFPRRPLVMGIVNLNDDSFCGDGTLDVEAAWRIAMTMVEAGADIIDAGAESARTNRPAISCEEEGARVLPFLRRWREWQAGVAEDAGPVPGQLWPPLLSINTWRPEVVETVLPEGGDLLNDMSALADDRNARLCAQHGAALLIMHSRGLPKEKHTDVLYDDIMGELDGFFEERLARAEAAGLDREAVVLDPGIGFAKQGADNLRMLHECGRLRRLGRPVLLPVSRKSVIGSVLGLDNPLDRDAGTLACAVAGVLRGGAQILRVHNVEATVQTVRVLEAVMGPADGVTAC